MSTSPHVFCCVFPFLFLFASLRELVLVVLQVREELQGGVEALEFQAALDGEDPLPPRVDPLAVQHVVWGSEEPRRE